MKRNGSTEQSNRRPRGIRAAWLLLVLACWTLPATAHCEDEPTEAPQVALPEEVDRLKSEALAKQEEADRLQQEEQYQEAASLYKEALVLVGQYEVALRQAAREAGDADKLAQLRELMEENREWKEELADSVNLLRIAFPDPF